MVSDRGPSSSGGRWGTLAAGVGLWGVVIPGIGLCCGLPVLLGTGLVVGAAGVAIGSGLLVAVGLAVGVLVWYRRRQRDACEAGEPAAAEDTGVPEQHDS